MMLELEIGKNLGIVLQTAIGCIAIAFMVWLTGRKK